MNASLVIPLFNNEKTARKQLQHCQRIMESTCERYEIIVCDDKSIDGSAALLKNIFGKDKHFRLIFHKQNQGIARTLKELYHKAKYPYIALFSVDGDWNPQDVKKLLLTAQKEHADIVIGKRTYQHYSFYRKSVSFFYNFLPLVLFGVKTIDAGSIKVIKREVIHDIPSISKNVFFEAEMIIRTRRLGKKVISVPIQFTKRDKNKGIGAKITWVIASIIDLITLRIKI